MCCHKGMGGMSLERASGSVRVGGWKASADVSSSLWLQSTYLYKVVCMVMYV